MKIGYGYQVTTQIHYVEPRTIEKIKVSQDINIALVFFIVSLFLARKRKPSDSTPMKDSRESYGPDTFLRHR